MINLASMPVLSAKISNAVNVKDVDFNKFYPVVATVTKQLENKDTHEKKFHDQIVIISDAGHWLEIYPGKCSFKVLSPFDSIEK